MQETLQEFIVRTVTILKMKRVINVAIPGRNIQKSSRSNAITFLYSAIIYKWLKNFLREGQNDWFGNKQNTEGNTHTEKWKSGQCFLNWPLLCGHSFRAFSLTYWCQWHDDAWLCHVNCKTIKTILCGDTVFKMTQKLHSEFYGTIKIRWHPAADSVTQIILL